MAGAEIDAAGAAGAVGAGIDAAGAASGAVGTVGGSAMADEEGTLEPLKVFVGHISRYISKEMFEMFLTHVLEDPPHSIVWQPAQPWNPNRLSSAFIIFEN